MSHPKLGMTPCTHGVYFSRILILAEYNCSKICLEIWLVILSQQTLTYSKSAVEILENA